MRLKKLFCNCKKWLAVKSNLQKLKGHKKISLSLFASYLIIMAAPTIAIIIIYFMARSALLDVQKEKAHRLLSESVITFDQNIEEIKNVGSFVAGNNDLRDFQKECCDMTQSQKFYALYLFARSYPNYPMMNQAIGNVYILIDDADYIVQVPAVVPDTKAGLSSLTSFQHDLFKKLMDKPEKYSYGKYIYYKAGEDVKNQSEIAFVQSLPEITEQSKKGIVVITLDKKNLDSLLEHALLDTKGGYAFIVDEHDKIIGSIGNTDPKVTYWDTYKQTYNLEQKYYIDTCSSAYSGWKLITATPKEALLSKIDNIKYIIIVLCIISVGIGVLICFIYWYRRKSMVQRYLVCVEGMDTGKEAGSFWGSLNHFLDSVESLQTKVTRQQRIVQKEILRKLLYGNYDSKTELEADMGEEGKLLYRAGHFYIVRIELKDTLSENPYDSKMKLAESIQFHFVKYLNRVHWIYEINHLSYAIIIAYEGDLEARELKEEFEKCNYQFYKEKAIPIFTGISSSKDDILRLSDAFEEASGIVEYAGFMGIHAPILKGDIPQQKENAVLSIDLEIQLEQTIKHGTEEELEKILENIGEYYINCFREFSMMQHMIGILQCTVMRSLEKGKKNNQFEQIIKDVQKAERPEEIFAQIRKAKQYNLDNKKAQDDEQELLMKKRLEKLIDKNYSNPCYNLAKLSDEVGISERKLYKEFKIYFDVTFSEYLEKIRIHNACDFLKKGMTVKNVAEAAGYSSDYSFRRAFRRVTGLSPSQFKEMN